MFHQSQRTFVTGRNVTRTMKLLVVAAKLVAWKKTRLPFEPPFWKRKMPNWKQLWMRWQLRIPLSRWKMKSYRRNYDNMRTKSSFVFPLLENKKKAPVYKTKLHYIYTRATEQKSKSKLWMKQKTYRLFRLFILPLLSSGCKKTLFNVKGLNWCKPLHLFLLHTINFLTRFLILC